MEPEQVAAPVADGDANSPAAQQQPRTLTADEEQASPEEQEAYNRFVAKGFELVYDKAMLPKVIDLLEGEGDPVEGLARTASMVISRVLNAASGAGQKLPGDVIFHGGTELFEDLAELSSRAGIKDFSKDPDSFEGAYFRALDQLRMVLEGSGDLNREAAQADLAQLQQMDAEGGLENFFRSLAAEDDASGLGPEPEEEEQPADAPPPQRGGGLMPRGEI